MVQIKISELRKTLSQEYLARLTQVERTATPLLARTTNVLIEYTEHTVDHSFGVEQIYDQILMDKFDVLNEHEKFFLLAATILHDMGMAGTKSDLELPDYEKRVRDQHHIISRERIVAHRKEFGFDDVEADLIGKIAEAHRKVNLETLEENRPYKIGSNVRVRLLGALIRLADELHVTNDRSPEIIAAVLSPGKISKMHHLRHQKIGGVGRSVSNPEIIEISAHVDDWELEDSLLELIGEIRSKHQSVNDILLANEIVIKAVEPRFDVGELVKKEVLLELAKSPLPELEVIQKLERRSSLTVVQALSTLELTGIVKLEEEQYSLIGDKDVFGYVFNKFFETRHSVDFVKSNYVEENIQVILNEVAHNIYASHLEEGQVEDRVLLLKNSPQAMDILLNKQYFHVDYGHLQRLQVLDVSILGGYLQDVTLNPSLAEDGEVLLAIQALENELHQNLGGLLQILKHVNQVDMNEGKKKR